MSRETCVKKLVITFRIAESYDISNLQHQLIFAPLIAKITKCLRTRIINVLYSYIEYIIEK